MFYSPNGARKCKAYSRDGEHNDKDCLICYCFGRCPYCYRDEDQDISEVFDLMEILN